MRVLAALATSALIACQTAPQAPSAQACAGISEAEVATTMSALRANVTYVERDDITTSQSRSAPSQRLAGSRIHLSPVVGVSASRLARVLQCNTTRGGLAETTVRARATELDVIVTIESDDSEIARDVLRRSESLALISPERR